MDNFIDPGPIEFNAQIKGDGSATWVDFPYKLKEMYGRGNLVPVKVVFDGQVEYTGSLAKMGGEYAMILIRKDKLKLIGKKPGEEIRVRVDLDRSERKVILPEDVQTDLNSDLNLKQQWEKLSYSHQREYCLWIEEAKKPETRLRRIVKMKEMLREGKKLR